ncbi:pilus assembly protein [Actinoallomurus acanthiterrae]
MTKMTAWGASRRTQMRGRADRGASTLELALLTPILLLVILLVVQFAMVYHARHVALAAAQSGARVAREQGGGDWKGQAEAKAREYIQQIGPELLTGVTPQAGGDQNQRWVTVTGTAVRVVPFLTLHVTQRSGGPIECYRPDVGAGTACGNAP